MEIFKWKFSKSHWLCSFIVNLGDIFSHLNWSRWYNLTFNVTDIFCFQPILLCVWIQFYHSSWPLRYLIFLQIPIKITSFLPNFSHSLINLCCFLMHPTFSCYAFGSDIAKSIQTHRCISSISSFCFVEQQFNQCLLLHRLDKKLTYSITFG